MNMGRSRKSGGDLSEAGLYNGPMLTIADHRRDSAGLTYVYPVVSRPGGRRVDRHQPQRQQRLQLGLYPIAGRGPDRGGPPPKSTSTACAGSWKTSCRRRGRRFSARETPPEAPPGDVAFSGNGEPTAAAAFPEAVASVRDILAARGLAAAVKIRLITNGSLKIVGRCRPASAPSAKRGRGLVQRSTVGRQRDASHQRRPQRPRKNLAQPAAHCRPGADLGADLLVRHRRRRAHGRSADAHCALASAKGRRGWPASISTAWPAVDAARSSPAGTPAADLVAFAAEIEKKTGVRTVVSP